MTSETPDFTTWTFEHLVSQRNHLEDTLMVSAGQSDPIRPRLRAEHAAICAEITARVTAAKHAAEQRQRVEEPGR